MRNLWVKDDSGNPTHSFKDRVVAVALAAARELGFTVLRLPVHRQPGQRRRRRRRPRRHQDPWCSSRATSSGRRSSPPPSTAARWSPSNGNYDDVNRLASEIAGEQEGWAFVNVNVRPYYAEGSKTLGYEVAEQLGWRLPRAGRRSRWRPASQLTKVDKGVPRARSSSGWSRTTPYKVFGAQATGCSPVSQAFKAGHDVVRPVRPDTIAKSLAIGNPADGPYVLDVVRRTGGAVEDVTDDEVVEGIRLLARTEGIFAETAGGVTVAALRKLVETGQLDPDAETVVFNTGDGLKTLDAVADRVGPTATVPSTHEGRARSLAGGGPLIGPWVASGRAPGRRGGRRSSPPPGPAPPRRTTPRRALG